MMLSHGLEVNNCMCRERLSRRQPARFKTNRQNLGGERRVVGLWCFVFGDSGLFRRVHLNSLRLDGVARYRPGEQMAACDVPG